MSSSFAMGLNELVTGAEIGRRLGVTRQAVRQWRDRPEFPEPLGRVGQAVVWDWSTIEAWADEHRPANRHPRLGGDRRG